ncbi:CHAT domain-containing protein [Stenomitos frigidus]|nr:CHAT domain-containing protein [Stenomitos frigidus]
MPTETILEGMRGKGEVGSRLHLIRCGCGQTFRTARPLDLHDLPDIHLTSFPSNSFPPHPSLLTPHPSLLTPHLTMRSTTLAIAPLLQTQAITGKQATKAAIVQKMPRARIIHLAIHGLLDERRGLGSALAFAPSVEASGSKVSDRNRPTRKGDRASDGLLTAADILSLPLNADLVVLSACDTGRGRISGDGVIGLSRSFLAAGASSLVVSLWAIPDAPTAELMTQFYRNLRQNNDKAQALRQAMLTTMKTHPNPQDWAAFTLIGAAQ